MNAVAESQQRAETEPNRRDVTNILVWMLLAIYAFARILRKSTSPCGNTGKTP
jgi:hypothetical protein